MTLLTKLTALHVYSTPWTTPGVAHATCFLESLNLCAGVSYCTATFLSERAVSFRAVQAPFIFHV